MDIKYYLKTSWRELWNPNDTVWQYTDRILFIMLPLISIILFVFPNINISGWNIMNNLAWIIPLIIWILFLLIVIPYRLVSKYHRKHQRTIDALVYHYIEGNKIKTKMFSDITDNVDDYDNLKELMSQWGKSLTNVFINNQNELGMVKLLEMSVENSNVVNYPISEDWDKEKHEYTIGLYIYIGVQLEKLKKIMQNLCSED